MIIKSNNETLRDKVLGAMIKMSSTPDDAIFSFTLMGVPIGINVDNTIDNSVQPKDMDALIYTDGRGIMITGNAMKVNEIFDRHGASFVLKHELEHILLNHISREKEILDAFKDYVKSDIVDIFNIASDYIINKDLLSNASNQEPFEFVDEKFMQKAFNLSKEDLDKKSAEEIVMLIMKNKPPPTISEIVKAIKKAIGGDGFSGKSSFSHVRPVEISGFDDFVAKNSKNFGGDFDKYLTDVIKNAITAYGTGQSSIWKKLDEFYGKPLVNWNAILTDELRQYKSKETAEHGVKVVNRRYYQLSSYVDIPILFNNMKRTFKDGVIAIDTSGSINDETYIKEISQAINLVKSEGLDWKVILFDDGIVRDEDGKMLIYHTKNISIADLTDKLLNRTYGGTDIKEVLDYCDTERAKFLILMSDMVFSYKLPKYDKFKKIFISTGTRDETNENVKELCDTLAFFEPY